jgi:hypothetical protein
MAVPRERDRIYTQPPRPLDGASYEGPVTDVHPVEGAYRDGARRHASQGIEAHEHGRLPHIL